MRCRRIVERVWRAGRLFFVFVLVCLIAPIAWAETDSAEADFIPWSGWWWPSSMGGLATGLDYNGHPAPLEKYDLLVTGSYPGTATQYYLDTEYDPDALDWNGLCHAYAAAAVFEKIEFFPSSYENIIFKVGDKKGLITACHVNDDKLYGYVHDPVDFHYWLLHYIKDQGLAFYAELDPSTEVWNFPVFRYEMQTTERGSLLDVICKIWYASDFVHPDYQGTLELSKTYTYTLILSGDEITGGEWTGDSVYDYPQQIVMPLAVGSHNPYLDYDLVRKIAVSRDDPQESAEPAELLPGGYNQVLADADSYLLTVRAGEELHVAVESLDALTEGIKVAILDQDHHLVCNGTAGEGERIEFSVVSENPPYTLNIYRNDYTQTGYYRLEYDLKRVFTFFNPNVQKGFGWGGFAISNDSQNTVDTVFVTGYDRNGRPLQTYAGPFAMEPGAKRIVQVSDFKVRMVERDSLYGAKVHATSPIHVVNLSGYYNNNMSATQQTSAGSVFVVPDILAGYSRSTSMSWGLFNQGGSEQQISATHFSQGGSYVGEAQIVFAPYGAAHYTAASHPMGTVSDGGWILIESQSEGIMGGYVQWLANNLKNSERLSLLTPATRFIVPHVYVSGGWATGLILINTQNINSTVSITLLDGESLAVRQVVLAPHEKQTMTVASVFDGLDPSTINACGLSIQADQPIAGYYTFETENDHLYFPLLEAARAETSLVIPHVASDSYWWTCANFFNPSETEETRLRLTPYDQAGQVMEGWMLERDLAPLKKDVFDVYALWGNSSGEIGFIVVEAIQGPAVVGLYAYGNMDNSMLAGIPFDKN